MKEKWHKRFLKVVNEVASWSKDRNSKMGSMIMTPDRIPRSYGYNGFPRNIDDDVDERHGRPQKYKYFEHSERNAIYNCAREGTPTKGCYMYIAYAPCSDCARGIIQAGITKIFIPKDAKIDNTSKWEEDWKYSKEMLDEAGVEIHYIDMEEEEDD